MTGDLSAQLGLADYGVSLVTKALTPNKPILSLGSPGAEQEAAHSLFRGAIGLFKNPRSHRFLDTDEATTALELLAFASALMRLLDTAVTNSG